MSSALQMALRLVRTASTQLSSLPSSTTSLSSPLFTRFFSALTSQRTLPAASVAKTWTDLNASHRNVSYDPYPEYEAKSPYKTQGPHRYGYKYKLWGGGLMPRPDPDDEDTKILPTKPYTYQKADGWTKEKALFGQNDYIDLLGDGAIHPWRTMAGPLWLRGFRGNEMQRNIRKMKFQGKFILDQKPARYHMLRKNIWYLYKRYNRRRRSNYWGRNAGSKCRIYRLRE